MIQYVVLEDLAYCSASRDIFGFVDFGDAELANLIAANDSEMINVLAWNYERCSGSLLRNLLLPCTNVAQGEILLFSNS